MALTKPQLVLLDVDGTLVDTAPDLAYSVNAMLAELTLPQHEVQAIRRWIGNGIEKLVHRALTGNNDGEANPELFNQAFSLFMDIYAENAARLSVFYPGVETGLDYLKSQDLHLGCVTNKRSRFTELLLKSLNIYDDFDMILCGDSLPKRKPDPMQLLHASEYFSVLPVDSLMIGDSTNDVHAARAAGFQVLCVNYGYNRGVDIRESNPDKVIDSLAQLPELFH